MCLCQLLLLLLLLLGHLHPVLLLEQLQCCLLHGCLLLELLLLHLLLLRLLLVLDRRGFCLWRRLQVPLRHWLLSWLTPAANWHPHFSPRRTRS